MPSPLEEQSEEVGRLQVSWLSWGVKTSHRMRGRCRKMRGMTQLSRPVTPKAESREGGAAAHGPLHRGEEAAGLLLERAGVGLPAVGPREVKEKLTFACSGKGSQD